LRSTIPSEESRNNWTKRRVRRQSELSYRAAALLSSLIEPLPLPLTPLPLAEEFDIKTGVSSTAWRVFLLLGVSKWTGGGLVIAPLFLELLLLPPLLLLLALILVLPLTFPLPPFTIGLVESSDQSKFGRVSLIQNASETKKNFYKGKSKYIYRGTILVKG
jgi:hypothetical protein